MARHTFVTASHTTYDETKTVEILSRSEVANIASREVETAVSEIARNLKSQERKFSKAAERATAAAKDAALAWDEVQRLVETARETFRDVIAEMLEPHYRLLAQHLGIELPVAMAKPKAAAQKCPVSVRTTPPHAAGESPISEGSKKKEKVTGKRSRKNLAEFNEEIEFDTPKRRILLANAKSKQLKPGKNTTVSNRVKPQEIKPCRKK